MANNRIYLRCRNCGEELFLGKRYINEYYWQDYYRGKNGTLAEQLNNFYEKHAICTDDGGLDCFDIAYELEPDWEEKAK